jgi:hypothetical protein
MNVFSHGSPKIAIKVKKKKDKGVLLQMTKVLE